MKILACLLIAAAFVAAGCPLPSVGDKGQPCFADEQCKTGFACNGERTCIVPQCVRDTDCGAGERCDTCVTEWNAYCEDQDFTCKKVLSALGDPCPFAKDGITSNADATLCASGLSCFGTNSIGSCPNGDADECYLAFDNQNADCVSGRCGRSFCVQPCDTGDACPAGATPFEESTTGDCYCQPTLPSDSCTPTSTTSNGCEAEEACVSWGGDVTKCIPAGPKLDEDSCDYLYADQLCAKGFDCFDFGDGRGYICFQICETNIDCSSGKTCYSLEGYNRWGACDY